MRSDVVIVGYRLNAKEPAAKALERILGLATADARALARSFPSVVAQAVPQARAEQLADALRAAGAQVELRDPSGAAPRKASTPASPARAMPPPASAARPPRASAPTEASGSYMLGDFGFEGSRAPASRPAPPLATGASVAPAAPIAPARAPRDDIAFDLALGGGLSLDLDDGSAAPARIELGGAPPPANDLHQLGERFDDLAPSSAVPQVEERAFRAIQQRARPDEPRRSRPPLTPTSRLRRLFARTVGAWLPSLTMLAALCALSALAVGYALDPSDVIGSLRRELRAPALAARAEGAAALQPGSSDLHPLLRAAPSSVRGPLASILRARIAGVHQLALSFDAGGARADCMLLEPALQADATRMASLRETGRPIEPPPAISAQLREQARVLNAAAQRPVALKPLCLAL